jgi:argininosuccinate lyase
VVGGGLELAAISPALADLAPALAAGTGGLADPRRSLAAKTSFGGSAPDRVREELARARAALEA